MRDREKNLVLRNGVYHFRAMVNGAVVRQSLRTADITEARRLRDEKLAMLASRSSDKALLQSVQRQLAGIEAEEKAEREDPMRGFLLSEAFSIWERDATRRPCGDMQAENHGRNWRKFLGWLMEHRPDIQFARQLDRATCMEWAADELQSCRAVNTYNHHITSIKTIFTSLRRMDEQLSDPFEFIHARSDAEDAQGKRPFTDEELSRIFASPETEFVRLAKVGLYTTLRLEDAARIRWEDFDGDLQYYYGTHHKTGADASHRVAKELRETLLETPADKRHGHVFPEFAIIGEMYLSKRFQDFLGRCGIQTQETVTGVNGTTRTACVRGFHSFRHTAITRALRNGATPQQVRRLAGHSSDRMQRRYTHLDADDAGDAADKIGGFSGEK